MKPLLALVAIVKDEAPTIASVLESVRPYVDHYTILDTGSTDGTQDIIRASGMKGILHEGKFVDFSVTRTAALDLENAAENAAVFAIMLSGGETLQNGQALVDFCEARREAQAGAYYVQVQLGSMRFDSGRLTRVGAGWKYHGAVHEVMMGPNAEVPPERVPEAWILHEKDIKSAERDLERWRRDAKILEAKHQENPKDTRTTFYLAQTYDCLGMGAHAIRLYEKRVALGGWHEEVFEARLRLCRLRSGLGFPWHHLLEDYLALHATAPHRAEPLYDIAWHYYQEKDYAPAFLFARRAAELPRPIKDKLFVQESLYRWQAVDLVACTADKIGEMRVGLEAARKASEAVPSDARLAGNLEFYRKACAEPVSDILTIGILSVPSRVKNSFPNVIEKLAAQAEGRPVEILALLDNKKSTVGDKRNQIAKMARGKYLTFVDDDDDVSEDYIATLLEAISSQQNPDCVVKEPDCVVFDAWITRDGDGGKRTSFGIEHAHTETADCFYRQPTHVCCHLTANVRRVPFPSVSYGEDVSWSERMRGVIKNQVRIPKVLYFYKYNSHTTETSPYRVDAPPRKRKYAVVTISPPGYQPIAAFQEVSENVYFGLRTLGYDVTLSTDFEEGRQAVVFGANVLGVYPKKLPEGAILYNFEQIGSAALPEGSPVLDIMRRHAVWDYSEVNVRRLAALGIAAKHVPVGYSPELTKIPHVTEDIDVLFYGSVNERRRKVLDALRERGLRVEEVFGTYGEIRDALIARSKIVLNMHYYETKIFEMPRVMYLLANRRFIVSEYGLDTEEKIFEGGVIFAEYENLAKTCTKYLALPEDRAVIALRGQEILKSRPETEFLQKALV